MIIFCENNNHVLYHRYMYDLCSKANRVKISSVFSSVWLIKCADSSLPQPNRLYWVERLPVPRWRPQISSAPVGSSVRCGVYSILCLWGELPPEPVHGEPVHSLSPILPNLVAVPPEFHWGWSRTRGKWMGVYGARWLNVSLSPDCRWETSDLIVVFASSTWIIGRKYLWPFNFLQGESLLPITHQHSANECWLYDVIDILKGFLEQKSYFSKM